MISTSRTAATLPHERRTTLRLRSDRAAKLTVSVTRRGSSRVLARLQPRVRAGTTTLTLRRRIGRVRLPPGRYTLTLAASADGEASVVRVALRVR